MNTRRLMNIDDFRYIRRGKQLSGLKKEELGLLEPVNIRGKGTDRALLLLHGFSSSPAVYRYLIPQIKHYDALVCPILPGHAESVDAFSQAKAAEWLSTATDTCAELIRDYKKVDILGLSLGGLLACQLSQLFPINHLYLLAPALKLDMNVGVRLKLVQFLRFLGFYHLRNIAGNLLSDTESEITYRKLPISAVIEMLTLFQNYQWVPPTCPIDLFLGEHDAVVATKQIAQLFAGLPNVSTHWLKNSAHVLPLEGDLQEIITCVHSTP